MMEGSNEQTLLQLKEAGAIQLVPSKMPVYQNQSTEEPGTNLVSILRLLIRNSANKDKEKDLQKITETDLLEACSQITEQKKDANLPPHFIPPIRRFGNTELQEKDLNYLRLLKKDHRGSTNPELVLKTIKKYHEQNDSKFTESTWIQNLHVAMPESTLQLINRAQLKDDTNLHTLWEDILHSFGNTRDNATIIAAIYRVTKNSTHPLNMIKEIADLVDQGTDRVSELESVALHEVQRAITNMIGPTASSSMHVLFEVQPRKTIRSYYNMANQNFYDLLNQPVKNSRFHHLADSLPKSPTEEKLEAMMDTVNNIQARLNSCQKCGKPDHLTANCPQARETRTCHNCGLTGHIASNCRKPKVMDRQSDRNYNRTGNNQYNPQRFDNNPPRFDRNPQRFDRNNTYNNNNRNSPPSQYSNNNNNRNFTSNQYKLSYKESDCTMHPKAGHTNLQCRSQMDPCFYRESHTNHKMSECNRTEDIDKLFNKPNFTSNARRIFNRPDQNRNSANSANSTPQTSTDPDITDPKMKAAMIDFIAKMK